MTASVQNDLIQMFRGFCSKKYVLHAGRGRRFLSSRAYRFSFAGNSRNRLAWLLPAVLLTTLSIGAQDRDEVIRVDTELASFEVTVTDKQGRPVPDLTQAEFRVFENGVERNVDFFQPVKDKNRSRPLSIVFALDVSGSMTQAELQKLKTAMQSFVKRLADYNSYFAIVSFAMDVKTLQSFTNKPERLERAFKDLSRDQDGLSTHAYDAVDHSIRQLWKKSPVAVRDQIPKRAVILITDGFPVGDVVAPETVIERANLTETSVYSVILPSYSRVQKSKKPLLTPLDASRLVEKTGGRSLYANENDFEPLFEALADEITTSYALAFYPSEENRRTAKFHEVRIESKKGFQIKQNRPGYTINPANPSP